MRKILLACTLILIFISIGLGAFHKTHGPRRPKRKRARIRDDLRSQYHRRRKDL